MRPSIADVEQPEPALVEVSDLTGDQLFALALSRPALVLGWCDEDMVALCRVVGPSYAWQARGLASREGGDLRQAIRHLRRAVSYADRDIDPDRGADTRASLATTLMVMGRTEEAVALLEAAESDERIRPLARARVRMRLGAVLRMLGRREEALAALGSAIPGLRAEGDSVWEARALGNRALVHLEFGSTARAARDLERCCALFAAADQGIEAAGAVHNMGWAAYRSGALGTALRSLDEAERRYLDLGVRVPQVAMDRCAVLLAAGLFEEAFQEINVCVASFAAGGSRSDVRADAALTAARAALAAGRPTDAIRHAALAERLYVRHDNARAVALARLEGVRARAASLDPRRASALAGRAAALAEELDGNGSPEAVGAALLAGRVAAAAGDPETALGQWRRAAAGRRSGTALDRVSGWLAVMLSAELGGSSSGVLTAAESGMRVLDTHRLSLGATELRAYATEHGRELADGALRQVVARGDAWALLRWTERWRATVIDVPVSKPATDPELVASLGALREVQRELTHGLGRHPGSASPARAARARGARPLAPGGSGSPGARTACSGRWSQAELCARRHRDSRA